MSLSYVVMLSLALVASVMLVMLVNNAAEHARLRRLRRAFEAAEKAKAVRNLSSGFPAQLMTAELKSFLVRVELGYCEIQIRNAGERATVKSRVRELKAAMSDDAPFLRENVAVSIPSAENLVVVKGYIQSLQQIIRAAYLSNLISHDDASRWVPRLRKMLVQVNLDFFTSSASHELRSGFPLKARQVLVRGLNYIEALPNQHLYAAELLQFRAALENAEQRAREQGVAARESGDSILGQLLDQMASDESKELKHVF